MKKLRVGVLFGGRSVEHEISLLSAQSVIHALDKDKYEVIPIGITKEGKWLPPGSATSLLTSDDALTEDAREQGVAARGLNDLIPAGAPLGDLPLLDVVFPLTHGTFGEDGTIQGLLELADVPYVGAGVLGSAVGMDKVLMKRVLRDAELPCARFLSISRQQWAEQAEALQQEIARTLGFPCFVKPSNGGSSVGVTKARSMGELGPAIETGLRLDRKVLVEEAILGRELECSVLGNEKPAASAVGEIVVAREFYDYEAKYHDDRTLLIVPAPIAPEIAATVQDLACRAFTAIDASGMARVDFFLRASDERIFVNEINTIPGFTQMSMYPKMWEAAGLSYGALLDKLIELAIERHQEKQRTWYNYVNYKGTE